MLVVVLGLGQLRRGGGETVAASPRAATIAVDEDGGGGRLVIHVAGAVRQPGVYRLRVRRASRRRGAARGRRDAPRRPRRAEPRGGAGGRPPGPGARTRPAGGRGRARPAGGASTAAPAPGQPLNINTATLEQLDTLSGIGPLTAQKILEFREEHGGFGSIEELGEIPGIGEKRLASLREEVTL